MRRRWPTRRRRRPVRRYRKAAGRPPAGRKRKIFWLLLAAGILILLNIRLHPMLEAAVAQQAGQVSVQAINEVINQVIQEQPAQADYLSITRDQNGDIQSIDTNTQAINQLKSELNLKIQEKLSELGSCSVGVPIGTLIGGDLFRGIGPKIQIRFTVASNAFCDLINRFDSAGVNQTRHSLSLLVSTDVYAMIPGCSTTTKSETTFCVAETIIVGKVPDLYWTGGGLNGTAAAEK